MPVRIYRKPLNENRYNPEVCGVNFGERMMQLYAESQEQGMDTWTAWADIAEDATGEGVTVQITQDIARIALSALDDDSDAVLIQDPRDNMYFRFGRLAHEDIFDWVLETVAPWAVTVTSVVPLEENYKPFLKQLGQDLDGEITVPEDW